MVGIFVVCDRLSMVWICFLFFFGMVVCEMSCRVWLMDVLFVSVIVISLVCIFGVLGVGVVLCSSCLV